jgi:ketosteroid isomerase-like protein
VRNPEAEVLAALRGRLDAAARNDTAAWARFVADDCLVPLEGATPSKQTWVQQHSSWPREVKYFYGPLEDVKVRVHGETAIATFHAKQFHEFGGQTTYQQRWQIETWMRQGGNWLLVSVADGLIPIEPTTAKVDPALYDAYAGQYEWAPTMSHSPSERGQADRPVQGTGGGSWSERNDLFVKGQAASGDSSRLSS